MEKIKKTRKRQGKDNKCKFLIAIDIMIFSLLYFAKEIKKYKNYDILDLYKGL